MPEVVMNGKASLWLVGIMRGSCRSIRLVLLRRLGSGGRRLGVGQQHRNEKRLPYMQEQNCCFRGRRSFTPCCLLPNNRGIA
jgi:hypothetical protein